MPLQSRKKMLLGIACIVFVVGLLGYFVLHGSEAPSPNKTIKTVNVENQQAPTVIEPAQPIEQADDSIDEVLSIDLAEQFADVADAYEQSARYPANSQVVLDAQLLEPKQPFEESEVNLKFPDAKGGELPISLAVSTDKFQYLNGETLTARLIVSGAEDNASINVTAVVVSPSVGAISQQKTLNSYAGSTSEFRAEFDTQVFANNSVSSEMLVQFSVAVNDQDLSANVLFKYGTASARLDSIPYSRPEGEFLIIPLQFRKYGVKSNEMTRPT